MISRTYLIVYAGLTGLSALLGILIFPEFDPLSAVVGLLVQLTGVLVVAYLRLLIASATVLIMTLVAAFAPTPWQPLDDHGLPVWIPIAASLVAGRVIIEARGRVELILSLAVLAAWCVITIAIAGPSPITVLAGAAPVLGGICIALVIRLREARRDRLASLEQARITAERERLLADLHDLITPRIPRVVLKSRQLAATADQPPVREGLGEIEQTATETLNALRDFLTAARPQEPTGDQGVRPVAELRSELAAIVAAERGLDQAIRLADPAGDDRIMINSAVHGCLVRAVREALTNAAKHAAGAPIEITLAAGDPAGADMIRLSVINGPPPAGPDAGLHRSGSGAGLRGLASRCHLLGGELTAEPDDRGGFAIRVELPVAGTHSVPDLAAARGATT